MVAIDPNWTPDYVQRVLDVEKEEGHTICGAALPSGEPCRKWASSTIGRCLKHADEATIEQFFARQPAPAAAESSSAPAVVTAAAEPDATAPPAPAAVVSSAAEPEPAVEFPRRRSRQLYFWFTVNTLLVLALLILGVTQLFPALPGAWGRGDEQLFAQGEKLYGEGNHKMALEQYRQLLDEYPRSTLVDRAKTRLEECRAALERQNYETIIQMRPDSEQARDAQLKLGATMQEQGQFLAAIKAYEAYLAGTEDREQGATATFAVSVCYQQLGQYKDAIDTLLKFLDRYPQDGRIPEVLFALGHLYQQIDDRVNAIRYFDLLREKYPEDKWAAEAAAALTQLR